jgi:hypothetical protein
MRMRRGRRLTPAGKALLTLALAGAIAAVLATTAGSSAGGTSPQAKPADSTTLATVSGTVLSSTTAATATGTVASSTSTSGSTTAATATGTVASSTSGGSTTGGSTTGSSSGTGSTGGGTTSTTGGTGGSGTAGSGTTSGSGGGSSGGSGGTGSSSGGSGGTGGTGGSGSGRCGVTVAVAKLAPPARLTIDKLRLGYSKVRLTQSRALVIGRPLVGRFHVVDSRGCSVSGAAIYAAGLPVNMRAVAQQARTDRSGWARFTFCAAGLRNAKRKITSQLHTCA